VKTIVLGGYGNFGARICRALAGRRGISVVVAGRDGERAARLAADLGGTASWARIDASGADLATELRSLDVGLVIHAAGPFQEQSYAVPLAVAAAGAHYIDLADGRRFVCDFKHAVDRAFRRQGKTAITGASTVPALSSAAIDALTVGWREVLSIDFCIAPAQTAPRGVATMAAVLAYCGAPIQVWEGGEWKTRYGWSRPQSVDFLRLQPRRGSLCDIPDLELFPARYPGVQSVMFRAALEIGLSQHALAIMAGLRRIGLLRHPERYANMVLRAADALNPFGSALGGMVVRVAGRDTVGAPVRSAWYIAADDDHGPEIPCMASILLAERLAHGDLAEPGAYTSAGWLSLNDFAPEFARWKMLTDVVHEEVAHGT
jgi:saccharopine dehydrogenase-like NADP-dependent oxidoreductase